MSQQLLEGRWDETKEALLEGLKGNKRTSMNVILENTRKYLKENASAGSFILSRKNAPLASLIFGFISLGKKAMTRYEEQL